MSPDTRPPLIRPIVSAERIVPAATMSLDWLTLLNEKQKCKIDPAAAVVSEASGRWEVSGGGMRVKGEDVTSPVYTSASYIMHPIV